MAPPPQHLYSPASPRPLLATLIGVSLTSNLLCSLIAPVLPAEIIHLKADLLFVGILFAGFPVAVLLASPFVVPKDKTKRIRRILLGLFLQASASVVFGYTPTWFEEGGEDVEASTMWIVLTVMFVSRLVQGIGSATANLSLWSLVSETFPANLGAVMGLNEVGFFRTGWGGAFPNCLDSVQIYRER